MQWFFFLSPPPPQKKIALIPKTDSMEIFHETPRGQEMLAEFDRLGCRDYFLPAGRSDQVPEGCRKLLMSISFYAFNGALERPCDCHNTGSESTLCDKYSGQCACKKNVNGRKCDRCDPGTFGFGGHGCKRERWRREG